MSDDRLYAPATLRNRDFILDVLWNVLPRVGCILEVASGSGEHVIHFANLPALVFQPSDSDPDALLGIAAWIKVAGVTNVRPPQHSTRRVRFGRSHQLTGSFASTWSTSLRGRRPSD